MTFVTKKPRHAECQIKDLLTIKTGDTTAKAPGFIISRSEAVATIATQRA